MHLLLQGPHELTLACKVLISASVTNLTFHYLVMQSRNIMWMFYNQHLHVVIILWQALFWTLETFNGYRIHIPYRTEQAPNDKAHVSRTSWRILLLFILVNSAFGTTVLVTSKQGLRICKEIGTFWPSIFSYIINSALSCLNCVISPHFCLQ